MNRMKIPYEDLTKVNEPYFSELNKAATDTIGSGWYILGNRVKQFEEEFAQANQAKYCIGLASGLDALILGLAVFDFPSNAKVLVPSNTYIASILAIYKAGLQPVLVEPDPYTYNLNIENLKAAYKEDCVAILPVHLYGRISPMQEIMDFAKEKNLKVIEDCAQSHFASINGKMAGTFGEIGAFSFYPTKNLGALGDAGAILCNNEEIYTKLKALRNYGSHVKYYNKYQGWNSRLDEMQAAFLSVKLPHQQSVILHKRKLAHIYLTQLKDLYQLQLPANCNEENHVWHIFNVLTQDRDALKQHLLNHNIGTEIHYPVAPHHQEGYTQDLQGDFPISVNIHQSTLSLPISTIHTENDVLEVCKVIQQFYHS